MSGLRASIDIGSNSTLLLIAKVNGTISILQDHANITALGRDIDQTKEFHQESMATTFKVLSNYQKICHELGILAADIIATATEASRVARNSKDFYQKIKNEIGINVKLLKAQGEAYYTALGASLGESDETNELILCDIGGASTEFILFNCQTKELLDFISLPVGSVRMKDWKSRGVLEEELKNIYESFKSTKLGLFKRKKIVWTAGTMTGLSAVVQKLKSFDATKVHQSRFSRDSLKKSLAEFEQMTESEITRDYPYLGKRAQTLASGSLLALQLSDWLENPDFTISNFGLRHGTLYQGKIDERYCLN